jgi:hypothetical protein
MEDTFYLLANPQYRQKNENYDNSIDDSLLILLNKKFSNIKITEDNYNINISKIENMFMETYQQNIISELVEEIITQVTNGQILL